MNTWWHKLSLRYKLQIPTQLMLLLVLTIAQLWIMRQFEVKMHQNIEQSAQGSAMQSFLTLNGMMLNGSISQADVRAAFLKKMNSQDDVLDLHLVRGKAVSDSFGAGLPEENTGDDMDRAAFGSSTVQTKIRAGEVDSLRVSIPIPAEKNFHGINCLADAAI